MKKLLILLTLSGIVFTACKKDDNGDDGGGPDDPGPQTRLDTMARTGGWIVTALTVDPAYSYGPIQVTDVYSFLDDCVVDNILMFKKDFTVLADEGASKCDPADPQQKSATWEFENDIKTKFALYGSDNVFAFTLSDTMHFTIKELGLSHMVTTNVEDVDGTEYTFTTTYKGN